MKRITQSAVALLLTAGLAFGGLAYGIGGGGMTVKGGGIGCCRDAV